MTTPGKILAIILMVFGLAVIAPDILRVISWSWLDTWLTKNHFSPFMTTKYPLGELGFKADNDGRVIEVEEDKLAGECDPGKPCVKVNDCISLKETKPDARVASGPVTFVSCAQRLGTRCQTKYTLSISRKKSYCASQPPPPPDLTVQVTPDPEDLTGSKGSSLGRAMALSLAEILGGFLIILCFRMVWRHPSSQTGALFLYSIWFNSGQYFVWYANLPIPGLKGFDVLQAIFEAAGLTSILWFALYFPRDSVTGWRHRVAKLRWAFLVFALLLGVRILTFLNFLGGKPTESVYRIWYLLIALVLVAIFFLFRDTHRTHGHMRPGIRWVWGGTSVGLLFWLLADSGETIHVWWSLLGESALNLLYSVGVAAPILFTFVCEYYELLPRFAASYLTFNVTFVIAVSFLGVVAERGEAVASAIPVAFAVALVHTPIHRLFDYLARWWRRKLEERPELRGQEFPHK